MCRWFFLFVFGVVSLFAANARIELVGHLSEGKLNEAEELVRTFEETPPENLLLEINSTSGDLQETLAFARQVYALRARTGLKVIVYIEDQAVGPAAAIPFVADELYASVIVSWGDVTLGASDSLPTNLLRSQVRSLIPSDQPKRELLTTWAEAMVDAVRSPTGEPLVVNQQEMQSQGVVKALISPAKFAELYPTPELREPGKTLELTEYTVDDSLAEHILYNPEGPNTVGHIEIGRGMINQGTWIYVKAALDSYKKSKPAFVILELNTPGGEVFSAQQISDGLKSLDTDYGIPVVAFINNWAISAGAMLAYSCRYIAVVKDASMGAAEPIMMGAQGEQAKVSEKGVSAIRTDFASRANFFDRDPLIAEAMVDKDLILVLRHGEVVKLESNEEIRRGGLDPDEVITTKGKLLTLNATQLMELGVADIKLLPKPVMPPTEEELDAGKWPAEKSLLFHYPFFKAIPDATIESYQRDWKMRFFTFLTHPAVASILFLGLMLGFYIELSSPGFGVPGVIGLVCLFFIVLSSFALQAANWLELLFLLLGLALIGIEVFVIPGFGITGVVGIILSVGALIALMLPGLGQIEFEWDTGTTNAAGEVFLERVAWLGGAILLAVVIMVILSKYFLPKFQRFSKLVLHGEQEGYVAGPDIKSLPDVGAKGKTVSPLRPSGKVEIDDDVWEAMSPGSYIAKGTAVVVTRYEGTHMIVEVEE